MPTFNSLSRDHEQVNRSGCRGLRGFPFNSLSRDHISHHLHGTPLTHFNSLSRDHPLSGVAPVDDCEHFNSLSRDHRARFRDFSALRGFLPRHPFAQMISKATIWIYLSASL